MTKYWCVNFDSDACLKHGIEKNLWLMQYQFADDHGIHQGDRKAAIHRNWKRLGEISLGDWFVAYLKPKTVYAIGRVRTPRRAKTAHDYTDTIGNYLSHRHNHQTGYVYYTPVFYEDLTDKWRRPDNIRYPQRIDVDEWQHYVPGGVQVEGLGKVPLPELVKAVFGIRKDYFEAIATKLESASVQVSLPNEQMPDDVEDGVDDSVIEVLEKSQAKGQGFLLDSKLRKALEDYAMDAAKRHFESEGYVVEDYSKNHPYDLWCVKRKKRLYVEVKGTQTNGESIILTSGEVEFARHHKEEMALFLLHSIRVSEDTKVLTNGQKRLIVPWEVDQKCLKPVSYKYELPSSLKTGKGL